MLSFGNFSFLPQSEDMCCRLVGISRLSVVCECVFDCALSTLSSVSSRSAGVDCVGSVVKRMLGYFYLRKCEPKVHLLLYYHFNSVHFALWASPNANQLYYVFHW